MCEELGNTSLASPNNRRRRARDGGKMACRRRRRRRRRRRLHRIGIAATVSPAVPCWVGWDGEVSARAVRRSGGKIGRGLLARSPSGHCGEAAVRNGWVVGRSSEGKEESGLLARSLARCVVLPSLSLPAIQGE